ncbi:M4 family peptidase [Glaciihabitans arcticus]|uniref:Neutral metalloproteinase n=1 Tax=Glaciihabitans arcticus TaxID=2668039 RepID=A0A4V2JEQ7_9MICO|nr:M4 family metallopeptidase [Glaciihabitans arcticus]TBN56429.1 M4 family peptidase [Glaciihabitans arcticus]
MKCSIVPPYLLRHLAQLDDPAFAPAAEAARRSLLLDEPLRGIRMGEAAPPTTAPPRPSVTTRQLQDARRTIFDARGTEQLPGDVVASSEPDGTDDAVLEAWQGLGHTHDLLRFEFERASIDDDNLELLATVHFGKDYDNAFWDGQRMVFGDGDGVVFTRMTRSLSVIGHELAHGVTQYTANLAYSEQSGALNESISDVFGALVEQRSLGQSAAEASWLIGEGIFTEDVQGSALRSMSAPGTAYDDDVLGKDPQPDHMDGFVVTRDDNGGVHLNSGIPNRAFYLVATAIGGNAWERPGQLWYSALTSGSLSATSSFAEFAALTVSLAGDDAEVVTGAWETVGVL